MYLICGEALFDVFPRDGAWPAMDLLARPGGSPFNVAIGLARLGAPVGFLGGVSADALGVRLREVLVEEGVGLEYLVDTPRPTTLSVIAKDAQGVPSYTFYGEGGADRMLYAADLPVLPPEVRVLHFGSYTTVVDPVASAFLSWLPKVDTGRMVSLDPNVRPTVEPDMQRWRDALREWLPHADVVKVSEEDIGLLYPQREVSALARSMLLEGPRLVVVTHGSQGASAYADGLEVRVPGREVDVVDTVGAGDSFQAALLHGLKDRERLEQVVASHELLLATVRMAVTASAITCTREGANPPRRQEIEAACAGASEQAGSNRNF